MGGIEVVLRLRWRMRRGSGWMSEVVFGYFCWLGRGDGDGSGRRVGGALLRVRESCDTDDYLLRYRGELVSEVFQGV